MPTPPATTSAPVALLVELVEVVNVTVPVLTILPVEASTAKEPTVRPL